MKCAHCSTPVPDTAKFCHNCGSQVSDAEGQAAATAAMDDSAFAHMEGLLREDTEGEFEIERPLGRGGMAVVYLATEIHLARKVAIKVLPPELTFGHGVERFKREAKTAAALDHPHIIPIYRIASGGKLFWYAMKYLEGRALDELLKEEHRFSLEQTIRILEQVADALDYAHEHQVIHRDMKPANVMLDKRNRVVVTDFGIAKALTEGTLTASGSVVGTPYYMSPEQGMGKPVTGAADQYSVAVMAYRMLSGQVPFEGDSAIDILHKHCMVAPPPLAAAQPGLPPHVYWAVHKALDKKPEGRFSSVTELVQALKRPTPEAETSEAATIALPMSLADMAPPTTAAPAAETPAAVGTGSESVVTPVTPVPAPSRPRRRRRAVAGAAVGLLVIVGAAGAGWMWIGQQRAESSSQTAQRPDTTTTAIAAVPGDLAGRPDSAPSAAETPRTEPAQQTTTTAQRTTPVQEETPPAQRTTEPTRRTTPPTRRTTPVPSTGKLIIVGLSSQGRVWIDGRRQRGTEFELRNGPHEVRLAAPGYEPMIETVTIRGGEDVRLPFTARPRAAERPAATGPELSVLEILVRPWANVSIDGADRGRVSRLVDTVLAGTHTIRLVNPAYRSKDTVVTLLPGRTTQLRIRMQRNP